MRISYSDEENYPGEFELWQGNCNRSLAGKKGQKSLQELKSALLALPSKRLIEYELDNGEDVCAIGALVRFKKLTPHSDPEFEMDEVGIECGMPRLVAWKVVEVNDTYFDFHYVDGKQIRYSPEERYEAVMKWIDKHLKATEAN